MFKSLAASAVLLTVFSLCGECSAQCSRGGGGSRASGGSGTLLTSPGSWAYNMMMQQAYQQHLAQQQYLYNMAKAAERAQKLEVRRTRAEGARERLAERREQIRREEEARRRGWYSAGAYVSASR